MTGRRTGQAATRDDARSPPATPADATQLCERLLADLRTEIARADSKASVLVAALGMTAGVFSALLAGRNWNPAALTTFGTVVWGAGAASLVLSLFALLLAVLPRYRSEPWTPGQPLSYFGDIQQAVRHRPVGGCARRHPARPHGRTHLGAHRDEPHRRAQAPVDPYRPDLFLRRHASPPRLAAHRLTARSGRKTRSPSQRPHLEPQHPGPNRASAVPERRPRPRPSTRNRPPAPPGPEPPQYPATPPAPQYPQAPPSHPSTRPPPRQTPHYPTSRTRPSRPRTRRAPPPAPAYPGTTAYPPPQDRGPRPPAADPDPHRLPHSGTPRRRPRLHLPSPAPASHVAAHQRGADATATGDWRSTSRGSCAASSWSPRSRCCSATSRCSWCSPGC